MAINLLPAQSEAVKEMFEREESAHFYVTLARGETVLTRELRHFSLRLPMGSGKTFIACEYLRQCLTRFPNKNFLVIIPYSLFGQWKAEVSKYFLPDFIKQNCSFMGYRKNTPQMSRSLSANAKMNWNWTRNLSGLLPTLWRIILLFVQNLLRA